jgi:glycosyltransferase involved in cell wall biosynthesis
MKISVVIPAYNRAKTIQDALNSVMGQTEFPDEILVLNDGSTDETGDILGLYQSQVTILQHERNLGVSRARNALCARAQGDLIAFLDSDDIWHPDYLKVQRQLWGEFPEAAAIFLGHRNFCGYEKYNWQSTELIEPVFKRKLMNPPEFLKMYNEAHGLFASMSYCCIPKSVLMTMGDEPFCVAASGAEDLFLFIAIPLIGRAVLYDPSHLVAYRITEEGLSVDLLRVLSLSVRSFELLQKRYEEEADDELLAAFRVAWGSNRRQYAKRLMKAGRTSAARQQLRLSVRDSRNLSSIGKSVALLFATYLPSHLQPIWPSTRRS